MISFWINSNVLEMLGICEVADFIFVMKCCYTVAMYIIIKLSKSRLLDSYNINNFCIVLCTI